MEKKAGPKKSAKPTNPKKETLPDAVPVLKGIEPELPQGKPGEKEAGSDRFNALKPTAAFTKALAAEIVKNLTAFGQMTTRPFRRQHPPTEKKEPLQLGEYPVIIDTSVLIDGRILPIVNSGFMVGTFIVPEFVLAELQHIADESDSLRRARGRRGLEVVEKLRGQKANPHVRTKVLSEDIEGQSKVDEKLLLLARKWQKTPTGKFVRLLTIDFNLGQRARAQGLKVLNINDLSQAIKVAVMPGEDIRLLISHEGKERQQGVGYLTDGTMVVVEDARLSVGREISVVITKVHQTPAGQLFFARPKL